MIELKDNYQDDVLDSEKNQLRKYNMIHNDDGTVSFVDATVYSQNGDNFGAKDVNDIVARIGEVSKAENIDYDGEKSVQGAIDEVKRTLGYTKSYNSLDNTASTITKNGLTFTVNSDKSVTVVGTPNADTYIIINTYTEKQGQHILSGCPSGGSASGYRLYCYNVSTSITINTDLGEGAEFTLDENLEIGVSILVKSGTVMNHTFYPMIRPADIEDDTYMPYEEDVHTRIKDLDGRILSIKQKTVTVTTDAHGNALLGLNSAVHLLNVKSETYMLNNMLGFIPCVSNYNWYVRVTQNSNTYNPLASKQITLIVTYLE